MAQMVKALRMILGMDTFGPKSNQPIKNSFDIEIEDDAPERKPSLEEIDALEVYNHLSALISASLIIKVIMRCMIIIGSVWLINVVVHGFNLPKWYSLYIVRIS